MCKIRISNSALTPWYLRLAFVLIMLWCFFPCDLLCLPTRVCPWEEAQIRLLRHRIESRDCALNFERKIVEFL
jgi:hypothetical protein